MNKQQVIEIENKHYLNVFARLPIVLAYGEGCWVYDSEGKKYLDFLAGIAVNALGYGNKVLAEAIAVQAGKLIHCSNLFYTQVQSQLVERLVELSGFDRVFMCNSGAEANEGAIKLARKYANAKGSGKTRIITAMHSFHGRTLATLVATGQTKYQAGYDPLPTGFEYVEYGDLAELEKVMADDVCAVLLEPIQGEGGVRVPPAGYLAGARALCDKYDALLIFDEIQTGVGRTGKWFGFEHSAVRPDVITLAKGLGGGFPLGAFLATEKAAKVFAPGDHGSTFGGNALACAAANAVLDVFATDDLLANVVKVGSYFKDKLKGLQARYPDKILEVRGEGLLLGMELANPGKPIVDGCLERGLIINCTAGNVIRLVPPLIVSVEEIDFAVAIMSEVMAKQ